jgi:hypothetical protein
MGKTERNPRLSAVYFPPPGVEATAKDVTQFGVGNELGYITFTKKFKYLGSLFKMDLRDDREIATRINKANQLLRLMTNIWQHKNITLKSKVLFYKAFCLKTILWGCESIILSAEIEYKLKTFHHKADTSLPKLH